jgi:ADP-L-glycero-D-manno-heptose 6-epimerase
MIVITGAAGFIGSNLVKKLNDEKFYDLVLVDKFDNELKNKNIEGKHFSEKVDRADFFSWIDKNHQYIQFVFHIGARTDTTEFNKAIFDELNLEYSKKVFNKCVEYGLPMVYASSAATYGDGKNGYSDNHENIETLVPLNPYGESKNEFDKWLLKQERKPYFWAGFKFFNVYGPNEYHKNRMASVILHAYNQIKETQKFKLFKSHNPDYKDGEQKRDFIYIKDLVDVLYFFLHHRKNCGIFNLGFGVSRTYNDLANAVFKAMNLQSNIEYIDTPLDIRDKYQYFTEAEMSKLRSVGYDKEFTSLENGVVDYVNFLTNKKYI